MVLERTCSNLSDFVTTDSFDLPQASSSLQRTVSQSDFDYYVALGYTSDPGQKIIVVANFLPVRAQKDESGTWCFSSTDDSIYLQLKEGVSSETDVTYVGSLPFEVEPSERVKVARELRRKFNFCPVFLPPNVKKYFYNGFCKQYLWPLFHYMLPRTPAYCNQYDRSLWEAYVEANRLFAETVFQLLSVDDDYVWVHDYHLMLVPTFLRKKAHRVKLGFFLHSPFPSAEMYMTLPVRDQILCSLLNADLVGFHTFDYARHFLSCCSRMLGLDYESKRGYMGIDYLGRTVYIKILPAGVHVGHLQSCLDHPSSSLKVKEIRERFKGKKLLLGDDDMDVFKGISLKFLAIEQLLEQRPDLRGELVLIQMVNPPRSIGRDVEEAKEETYLVARKINERFGSQEYEPVVIIDHPITFYEKAAYYALSECCIVNAVRDGMNLVPYMYVVCRQGTPKMDEALEINSDASHTSALVVSEFIGCSPSLSGAVRVNPWDINAVAEALSSTIQMSSEEKHLRHQQHYRYVSSHDVAYWAKSFLQDLQHACIHHNTNTFWNLGWGSTFKLMSVPPNFGKLPTDQVFSAYKESNSRAIFLDYDGTLISEYLLAKMPGPEVIYVVNSLCSDPRNTVFIVSGRRKTTLSGWFNPCENLGIAAEHGYFMRWNKGSDWETSDISKDFSWKTIVEPVMRSYTESTDESYIESKETGLVWHYKLSDPSFGSWQANELLAHLEGVLANEPAVAKRGEKFVEVKPRGINKGLAAKKVLSTLRNNGKPPDFVMCIGDDRSDEDMFATIQTEASRETVSSRPEIFACTVGCKTSKARYYVDNYMDVLKLLAQLARKFPFEATQASSSV